MARPRSPTALLELRGTFKKNPSRRKAREGEPVPTTQIGAPPDYLTEAEALTWREMATEGTWLAGPDRFLLEVAAVLMALHRAGAIEAKERAQLVTVLSKLGFGPAERSKIRAPGAKEPEENPFAQFN